MTDAGTNLPSPSKAPSRPGRRTIPSSTSRPGCPVVDAPTFECAATQPGRYVMSGLVSSSAGESPLPAVTLFVNPPPTFASIILSATATETGVPVTIRDSVLGGTGNYSYKLPRPATGVPERGRPRADVRPDRGRLVQRRDRRDRQRWGEGVRDRAARSWPPPVRPGRPGEPRHARCRPRDRALRRRRRRGRSAHVRLLGAPRWLRVLEHNGLSCAPSANGTFTVQVSASDQFGYSASGSVRFTVHPRLVAPTFTANSSSVHLGDNVSFTLSVSGGTAPYRYIYTGTAQGCSTLNDSAIQCDPRATGHFVIRVTVTDDFGESVTDNTTLTVDLRTGLVTNPNGIGGWVVRSALAGGHASRRRRRGRFDGRDRLVLRRNRRFAFEGRQIVAQLLDDAPALGDEFGRFDDPTRPQ